jgi:acyl carrier protein
MNRSIVLEEVRGSIADSLAVPREQITLESRLVDDLGADSLDLVDIVFTLERKFQINVRETEFNFLTRLDFSSPEVMSGGFLTADIVDQLEGWLSLISEVPDRTQITPRQLFGMITVESICIVVERRLPVAS